MTGQSKMANAVLCTCKDFQHPWTDKCVHASAGLLFAATPYCLRVYTMVYLVSGAIWIEKEDLCLFYYYFL